MDGKSMRLRQTGEEIQEILDNAASIGLPIGPDEMDEIFNIVFNGGSSGGGEYYYYASEGIGVWDDEITD